MKNLLSATPAWLEGCRRRREESDSFLNNHRFSEELEPRHLGSYTEKPIAQAGARTCRAFSLLEILVVVGLLSVIVIALMSVFSNTQRAFRAVLTQTDVLQGGRSAMELMAADLRGLTPSYGTVYQTNSSVNYFSLCNLYCDYTYVPLVQTLPGSAALRTNILNYFFILGRENTRWIGVGYVVASANGMVKTNGTDNSLYPLYRFYRNDLDVRSSPVQLYNDFTNRINLGDFANCTNMSHVMDGVAHMVVRAYDTNGTWVSSVPNPYTNAPNIWVSTNTIYGESQLFMYSNAVPASIELELGVLEDRVLQHAEALPSNLQSNYLSGQSGAVHLFRQRVAIPTLDPTAY